MMINNKEMEQEADQNDKTNSKLKDFFAKHDKPAEQPSFVVDKNSDVGQSITSMLLEYGYTKESERAELRRQREEDWVMSRSGLIPPLKPHPPMHAPWEQRCP